MIPRRLATLLGLVVAASALVGEEAPRAVFGEEILVLADAPLVVPVEPGQAVEIRFGVGEIDITASAAPEIRTELEVRCGDRLSAALCDKYRDRLRLESRRRRDRVEVRLVGLPRWKLRKLHLEGSITVPASSPLGVRIGVGDVEIRTAGQDLAVAMGIGDLTVHAPERQVGGVEIATRIGDATLTDGRSRREGKRRLLLGSRLRWHDGLGAGEITLALKIGDAAVVLE